MKILLTINDITTTGGAERVVCNLANALMDMGYEVEILSFFRTNATLPYTLNHRIKLCFWHNTSESIHKQRYCHSLIPRLYYKNLYKSILSLRLSMRYRGVEAIISSCSFYTPFIRHKRTKYIKWIHGIFSNFHRKNRFYDTLIILSSDELATWQGYHPSVRVIPNFLPSVPQESSPLDTKIVLSVGRLTPEKGFLRLIDIWNLLSKDENLKGWNLHIVGDGEQKEAIESKIEACALRDSITLKPFTRDIQKAYQNTSIYAMTSFYEGFGMVLVESASFGIPAIAFDVAVGPSNIIEHERSGYLVADGDLFGFVERLKMLMNDTSLRAKMGGAAKKISIKRFGKAAILPLWQEVLKSR